MSTPPFFFYKKIIYRKITFFASFVLNCKQSCKHHCTKCAISVRFLSTWCIGISSAVGRYSEEAVSRFAYQHIFCNKPWNVKWWVSRNALVCAMIARWTRYDLPSYLWNYPTPSSRSRFSTATHRCQRYRWGFSSGHSGTAAGNFDWNINISGKK